MFCPDAIQPHSSVYSAFCGVNAKLYRPCHKTSHRALQRPFLLLHPLNRPRYQTDTNGYNTACATLEHIHAPGRTQPIPDATATPGRCTGQHRPPIIIRYIRGCRGAPCCGSMPDGAAYRRPCQRWRVSSYRVRSHWQVLHPAHLLRGQRLHLYRVSPAGSRCFPRPAGQSSSGGAAGRRGTIGGYRRISFRAFAR